MTRHDSYGTYDPDIHKPFSPHLSVEQGEGTKGRPKKNTIVEMKAPPEFIKRFKPTKVGKHKKHLDIGIEEGSASDYCQDDESFTGVERHIIAMANSDDDLAEMLLDNIDNL